MEWNWCWHGNDVSPFMLCESSGDSEEVKSNIHHHDYNYHESTMDDVSFRFDDKEDHVDVDVDVVVDDDDDDDAQSCSYDHSSYINTSYGSTSHIDQSQRLTYDDDHEMDDDGDDDDGDVVDDDDNKMINKNWGESKLTDSSKQPNRSHKYCGDSSSQREMDKQFWETCLAS